MVDPNIVCPVETEPKPSSTPAPSRRNLPRHRSPRSSPSRRHHPPVDRVEPDVAVRSEARRPSRRAPSAPAVSSLATVRTVPHSDSASAASTLSAYMTVPSSPEFQRRASSSVPAPAAPASHRPEFLAGRRLRHQLESSRHWYNRAVEPCLPPACDPSPSLPGAEVASVAGVAGLRH
jgi:hypothetical protein